MSHITISLDDGSEHRIQTLERTSARSLAGYLETHGFPLNTRCGKRGLCCGCEVQLSDGRTVKSCQIPANNIKAVSIPTRSRMEHQPQVGDSFRIDVPIAHQPVFEVGNHERNIALAIDLGTTTVVVMLIDLNNGEVLGRAGGFNQQIRFGDNVLTRIDAARDSEVLKELQLAITRDTLPDLIELACQQADRPLSHLAGAVLAGNTTMLHLMLGENPTALGVAPFTPTFIEGRQVSWQEIELSVPEAQPQLPMLLLPGIAAFIGADIVAGIYASGMMLDSKPSILVDIGTNGEIVLQHQGKLTTCATAAGPAFEGGGLRCGTRARDGAISRLELSLSPYNVDAEIIGQTPLSRAAGICGSAYVDFLAEAWKTGLISQTGRFIQEAWDSIPDCQRCEKDGERAVKLTSEDGKGGMVISEVDIAVILQAKAAIGAGIETLLECAGISAPEIGTVYLAGGFGMHLDVSHAIEMGLLPEFQKSQIEVVGNTSLAGAILGLLDSTTLTEMETIRHHTQVIELNSQENFEDCYIEHLMLP